MDGYDQGGGRGGVSGENALGKLMMRLYDDSSERSAASQPTDIAMHSQVQVESAYCALRLPHPPTPGRRRVAAKGAQKSSNRQALASIDLQETKSLPVCSVLPSQHDRVQGRSPGCGRHSHRQASLFRPLQTPLHYGRHGFLASNLATRGLPAL